MDRKRAAASAAEEAALQGEKTPSIDSATVIVTPERAKKPRQNEGGDPNSTEKDSTGKRESEAEKDVGGEAEKEQDNSGDNGNDDGVASAVVVDVFAADKPPEAATSAQLTADSVMGFPMLPKSTNREIMTHHIDFVKWAKSKKEQGPVYGRLKDFLEWVESPEGKGFERFTFGQHKGQTFEDVALRDPEYHVRYMHALQKHGESPHGELALYIAWFKNTKGPSSVQKRTLTRIRNYSNSTNIGNLPF